MKDYKSSPVLRKWLSVLLIAILVAGVIPAPYTRVAEANDTNLQSDPDQEAQAAAMGLSTEQPSRLSPSGKVVDKAQSPLGSSLVVLNKVYQLAIARGGAYSGYTPLVTNNVFTQSSAQVLTNEPVPGSLTLGMAWSPYQQVTIGADIDADGQQELVTIGLVADGNSSDLKAYVSDYNQATRDDKGNWQVVNSSLFTLDNSVSINPANLTNTTRFIRAVAGDFDGDSKEEVAVLIDGRVRIVAFSMTASTTKFTNRYDGISDMEALDTNRDGFPELLLTINGVYTPTPIGRQAALLYIYNFTRGWALSIPQMIPLSKDNTSMYFDTQVDMGNIFGTGEVIVVSSGLNVTCVQYNPVTETYIGPQQFYSLYDINTQKPSMKAVKGSLDLKCASLGTATPGSPEYVVIGGFIFLFDKNSQTFVLQQVTSDNSSGLTPNTSEKSHDNITNSNWDRDETYILDVLVGNFDGNTDGREQIIILHYNKWHNSEYLYLTGVRKIGNDIKSHLTQQWKKDSGAYVQTSISAPYILDRGVKLEFLPERSTFAFSNPVIMAVLGASPYYQELYEETSQIGNAGTTFGTGTEVSNSAESSFRAEAGVSIGFHQGFGVFGVELFSIDIEAKVSASITSAWSTGTSVSKSTSFTSYPTQDGVVLMVVPYDIYVYKATTKDASGNIVEDELIVEVPYEPMTTMMPLEEYNRRAASIPGAPIAKGVLKHTIGDPRTYPTASTGLSNMTGDAGKPLVATIGNADEATAFTGAGIGDGTSQQTIDSSHTEGKTIAWDLSVEMSFKVAVAGVSVGFHGGLSYGRSASVSTTKMTTRQGVVANVPTDYSHFQFRWALVVYNYELQAGSNKQAFPVVTYMVRMDGEFPPRVPANFTLESQTLGVNVLKWDPVPTALTYRVLRSESETGTYTEIANLADTHAHTYTDNSEDLMPNQSYYYKVWASNSKDGAKSAPLSATTLFVTGMSINTEPKLVYEEGEGLDLSDMIVTLNINNGTTMQVAQTDSSFGTNFTTSKGNGVALAATDSGSAITVTYTPANKSVNTASLTVNAKSPYDFAALVTFKVGGTTNVTTLTANQTLEANVELSNKSSKAQDVLVILALYSDKGNMELITYTTKNVSAAGSATATLSLALPSSVSGYTAKVFTWDGTSLTTTTLTPKAPIVRIPG